ncbi:MAG: peptidase, partial [Calditrichia bacterium]|nr:peptidase [Calditrichia bacterium]
RSLGNRETGGRAALPMWIEFMGKALKGKSEAPLEQPPGLVTVKIDPKTGQLADSRTPNAIFEIFRSDRIPKILTEGDKSRSPDGVSGSKQSVPEQIF